jgi:hypothetical protein
MSLEYEKQLDKSLDDILASVSDAAESWGAIWEPEGSGGILRLPVSHGLRQSLLEGPLSVEKDPVWPGSTLRFLAERTQTKINWTASLVLLLGAVGGVVAMLWPFFPNLLRLAPAGIVLAIAAWLLVASRLRTADVDDFLRLVAEARPDQAQTGILDGEPLL